TRDDLIYLAKLAEQTERYKEMKDAMYQMAKMNVDMTVEERNLLSVAYRNLVGERRASWRIIKSIQDNEESKGNQQHLLLIAEFRSKIEEELNIICDEVFSLLKDHLLPASTQQCDAKTFYHKLAGDYLRYKAEVTPVGEAHRQVSELSMKEYEKAMEEANQSMPRTHPIRLGLALSYAVFYYEILNRPEKAIELAKNTFDGAIADLDGLPDNEYRDATLIMQMLRDNMTLWTAEMDDHSNQEHDNDQ
ncbi:hypothetical protein SAMD00019534_036140, partial [Acytostelium subglobosum LB1]|uniref:hypothetical protein n=1 Tax=Acytostelium subglobosum LB1 TaxID=1410327 RepID=UPI000644B2F2